MANKNSTTQANIRSGPKSTAGASGHTGSVVLALPISFDPAAAAADTGINLPASCIVVGFAHDGGGTGGTNPTLIVGTSADTNGYITAAAADAAGLAGIDGALANTATTAATAIYAGVGTSAATGGTVTGNILYKFVDSASGLNE